MAPTTSCCGDRGLTAAHLGQALGGGSDAIAVANHAAERPVRPHADMLVVGRIVTNNPAAPTAEAMAVSGGQIIGIGALSDLEGLTDSGTITLKPDGIVLPGLIEPHMHIWTSLLNLAWTDLSHEACPTFDEVIAALKSAAARTPVGQWVQGKLFDPSLYPGEPSLTRAILDTAVPDHPVIVMNASMHYLYANSPAFVEAGITDQTPDPPGGEFGRADGRLNGIIGEAPAIMMMMAKLPKPSRAEVVSGITQILNACAAQGVTSLREAATGSIAGPGELAVLHQMNGTTRLPVRVSTAQFSIMAGCATPADVSAAWTAAGVTPFSGDEMVRADAWKVVVDGSNQGRSGYFFQPYLGEDTGGHANLTPEGLHDVLKAGLDGGWQMMVHTNGDAAVEFALTAMEQLLPGYPANDLRHRFEHVSFTTDDQLARMARAGIAPSFLMNHVYYWGAAFRDTILGPARADRLDRVASAYKAGLRPSFHSDYNVSKVHPLQSARTGVLRQLQVDGSVLNPAECVTREQALAAITTHAAWQIHADDRGSLEVGKRADFSIADANPWESDPAAWDQIAFHATYIDGTPAWQS